MKKLIFAFCALHLFPLLSLAYDSEVCLDKFDKQEKAFVWMSKSPKFKIGVVFKEDGNYEDSAKTFVKNNVILDAHSAKVCPFDDREIKKISIITCCGRELAGTSLIEIEDSCWSINNFLLANEKYKMKIVYKNNEELIISAKDFTN